jgi:hypothetical protein
MYIFRIEVWLIPLGSCNPNLNKREVFSINIFSTIKSINLLWKHSLPFIKYLFSRNSYIFIFDTNWAQMNSVGFLCLLNSGRHLTYRYLYLVIFYMLSDVLSEDGLPPGLQDNFLHLRDEVRHLSGRIHQVLLTHSIL